MKFWHSKSGEQPEEKSHVTFSYLEDDGTMHTKTFYAPQGYDPNQQSADHQKWVRHILTFRENQNSIKLDDGGSVKHGDRIYGVSPDLKFNPDLIFDIHEHISRGSPAGWKYFAHMENAEKYIEENKPRFSKDEIRTRLQHHFSRLDGRHSYHEKQEMFDRIKPIFGL